jgi:hypothetical protein
MQIVYANKAAGDILDVEAPNQLLGVCSPGLCCA